MKEEKKGKQEASIGLEEHNDNDVDDVDDVVDDDYDDHDEMNLMMT